MKSTPIVCQGCTLPCNPHHHNDVAVVCARGYGWSRPVFHPQRIDHKGEQMVHIECATPMGRQVLCCVCLSNYEADYGRGTVVPQYSTLDDCECCGAPVEVDPQDIDLVIAFVGAE